jgi:hypothetical protein
MRCSRDRRRQKDGKKEDAAIQVLTGNVRKANRWDFDMAHSVWKGQISFGMVSFPVKQRTAARSRSVRFHQLHPCGCPSRIRQVLYCRAENVPRTELVKGFEYDGGCLPVLSC